ncbi:sensor histidine kinase [Streptomyces griseus]|uniref:sensor histidine kinase n=1 Tax=Streptomyces griseus TaxID=1911 RepID=UPI0033D8817A
MANISHCTSRESEIAERIVDRYRASLEEVGSPLALDEEIWEECERQARSAIADCYRALRSDGPQVRYSDDAEFVSLLLGARRALQDVPVAESVRASHLLISAVLDGLPALLEGIPADEVPSRLLHGVGVLHQSVGARVRAGFVGYDAFLLQDVGNINTLRRTALARDIHDRIGSNLSLALRCLELHELLNSGTPAAANGGPVADAKKALHAAFLIARDLVNGLRSGRPAADLASQLSEFADTAHPPGTDTAVAVNGDPSWVPDHHADEVFLVTRECMRNAFAHSGAKQIHAEINITPRHLQGAVRDDGVGIRVPLVPGQQGNGLASIRERVQNLGGTVVITGRPGVGTCVRFRIPLPPPGEPPRSRPTS